MNAQPDLFTPLARTSDPETSKIAGREAEHRAPSQRQQILNALRAHGPMTYWQIDNVCGFDHPTSARRMGKLVDDDLVRVTDETRLTGKGSPASVYEAMQNVVE